MLARARGRPAPREVGRRTPGTRCARRPRRGPAPAALRGAAEAPLPRQRSGGWMGDKDLSLSPESRGGGHSWLWEAECLKVQLGSGAGPPAPVPGTRGPVTVETSKARVLAGRSFGAPAGLAPLLLVVRFHSGGCNWQRSAECLLPPLLRFSLKPQSAELRVESRPPHFFPGTGMLITVVK